MYMYISCSQKQKQIFDSDNHLLYNSLRKHQTVRTYVSRAREV